VYSLLPNQRHDRDEYGLWPGEQAQRTGPPEEAEEDLETEDRLPLIPVVFLFLILLGILTFAPHIIWRMEAPRPLEVVVLDKAASDSTFREHQGLFWTLNHLKWVRAADGKPFDVQRDYWGLDEGVDEARDISTPGDSSTRADLIYIADTGGLDEVEPGEHGEGSRKGASVHGGLSRDELRFIRGAHDRGATLVAELNSFGGLTDARTRRSLTDLLGVEWSGWVGRYVRDLSQPDEVPVWFVEERERRMEEPWSHRGPGFILAHLDGRRLVLEVGTHAVGPGLALSVASARAARYGLRSDARYLNWFDISWPSEATEVVAEFRFDLTPEGSRLFEEFEIPLCFPAVLRRDGPPASAYYFAGDFADLASVPPWHQFWGAHHVLGVLPLLDGDPMAFLWKAYVPLMRAILEEIREAEQRVDVASGPDSVEDPLQLSSGSVDR
jgi:hypothetical protein